MNWEPLAKLWERIKGFFVKQTKKSGPESSQTNSPKTPSEDDDTENNGNDNSGGNTEPPEENETCPKPPIDAPGQRGPKNPHNPRSDDDSTSQTTIYPELLWRELEVGQTSEIVLSVPNECEVVKCVVQCQISLTKNDNCEYLLPDYRGELIAKYSDDTEHKISLITDKMPLIFKTSKNWKNPGRKVKQITVGHFIVVTPKTWTRLQNAPVSPLSCTNSEYMAHFFYADEHSSDKQPDGFNECGEIFAARKFELIGTNIEDSSDDGCLYIDPVPKLELKDDVLWFRVGEEGGNWKGENFRRTNNGCFEQVLHNRNGHFYIRVYEDLGSERVTLVDSDQFRYSNELKKILLAGEIFEELPYRCPSPEGHRELILKFVDAKNNPIIPKLKSKDCCCEVRENGETLISNSSDCDRTTWVLPHSKGSIEVEIKLNRVWWRLDIPDTSQKPFQDTPLEMSRSKFKKWAKKKCAIVLLLGTADAVRVGFNGNLDRTVKSENSENDVKTVELGMSEFADYTEIEEHDDDDAEFQVQIGEEFFAIVRILDEVNPTPEPGPVSIMENHVFVKGRIRSGRGFSQSELCQAGLTKNHVNIYKIRVDPRRRTSHETNVNKLRSMTINASAR